MQVYFSGFAVEPIEALAIRYPELARPVFAARFHIIAAQARGIGGIFFDYMDATDAAFAFVRATGDAFLDAYVPIVGRRRDLTYSPEHRFFQEVRRGRYVEFNLVYDRGTVFGLKTDGRTESILMSLPPVVRYLYDYRPAPNSPEAELTDYWLVPRDWAGADG